MPFQTYSGIPKSVAASSVSLSDTLDSVKELSLELAIPLAAVATMSMAFMELIKAVFFIRKYYHKWCVIKWIGDCSALNELLVCAAGGREHANVLYDQPTDKMMGQIQAAATQALEYPGAYPKLYGFIAGIQTLGEESNRSDDTDVWLRFCTTTDEDDGLTRAASQARARLGNIVARKLDTFQTRTEYWWARLNQTAATLIGCGIIYYALTYNNNELNWGRLVVYTLIGGLLSPFAKDIVSALTNLKTRR